MMPLSDSCMKASISSRSGDGAKEAWINFNAFAVLELFTKSVR
jgi:hypothetical protein